MLNTLVTGANGFLGSWLVRALTSRGLRAACLLRPGSDLSGLVGLEYERVEGDVTDASSLAREEEDPLQPAEWYGESKAEAERLAFSYADRLPVTVVRPPRIVGPGDRENLLLFKLVARGLRLELGGGPRPLTLVDVEDVVDLLLLLAERDEALGQAFFVGYPRPFTLEELQALVAEALGVKPRTVRLPPTVLTALATVADGVTRVTRVTGRRLPLNRKFARQLLAPAWTCSSAKAERLLGFRATRDPADSIRRSARWYKEHGWL